MGLADDTPEALAWLEMAMPGYRALGLFNDVKSAVIWSDVKNENGEPIIDIDPDAIVAEINIDGHPLLLGHDPGRPVGRVLAAQKFVSPNGNQFVAAVLGLYAGQRKSFADLNIITETNYPPPNSVPFFDNVQWINMSVDPREFTERWLEDVIANSPFPIRATRASNNELKSPHQLIRLGIVFVTLAWNPFVTTIAEEAGKDVYGALRTALSRIVEKAADLDNPLIELQSFHDGCQISFILRRRGVQAGAAAMSKLSVAATQAQHLISNLKKSSGEPRTIVYEYDAEGGRWYPSFAELKDGTFITDNVELIAIEELPNGLSMGLVSTRNRPKE